MKLADRSCLRCGIVFKFNTQKLAPNRGQFCSRSCARRRPQQSPETLFWLKVFKTDTCWIWTGAKDRRGYGRCWDGKKIQVASRWIYEFTLGKIQSKGMDVCHKCDNPSCVNPDHLFLGTRLDNVRDCIRKGRAKFNNSKPKSHCKRGHALLDPNLLYTTKNKRRCKICVYSLNRKYISEGRGVHGS